MPMYEELMERLRNCATEAAPCKTCGMVEDSACTDTLMKQAADAIEELQAQLMYSNDAAKAIADKVPKWIPVTEMLPEEYSIVLLCSYGDVVVGSYDSEYKEFRDLNGFHRLCTHWMPRPKPPKEE